jgi:exopolysaccharide biosynthesis polyprenyl glycosylphosphotransferase
VYPFTTVVQGRPLPKPRPEGSGGTSAAGVPEPYRPARRALLGERCRIISTDMLVAGLTSLVPGSPWLGARAPWPTLLIGAAVAGLASAITGSYRSRLQQSALDGVPRTVLSAGIVLLVASWLPLPGQLSPARPAAGGPSAAALLWPVLLVVCVTLGRALVYTQTRRFRRRAAGDPTLVVGPGDMVTRVVHALSVDRSHGLAPIGFVATSADGDTAPPLPLLGTADGLDRVIEQHRPRHVILAFAGSQEDKLLAAIRTCRRRRVSVLMAARPYQLAGLCARVELIHGIPLIRLRPDPSDPWRWMLKRTVDVGGAALGLVMLAPVLACCALAVQWESRGNGVLFRQERVGLGGKRFTMVKFRSLMPSSDLESQIRWSISSDPRVGPVGRALRRTSLDELPQLLNVLRGDMSLVGPRPERPYFVEEFRRLHADYADRHRVPAGITGWAQIHGLRGDTSIPERVFFDNYYIDNWSLGLDIKIMMRTIGSMFRVGQG